MTTETKSGRVVRTPGKYSTCVSGQRKATKNRKMQSDVMGNTFDSSMTQESDITRTSLIVNTSEINSTLVEDESVNDIDETKYNSTVAKDKPFFSLDQPEERYL